MSNWSAGYVADIGYTFGYYAELNPLRVKLAFLNKGMVFPEVGTACELGFGQGLSAVLHSAASVVQWSGTDFNPAQAGFAQELAALSGTQAKLYDESFAEFSNREDLPEFDYIGLHGIWSWISDENRAIIVEFVRRKLKVGGVLYISYNTLPGWATFAPMRHLMTEHAEVIGSEGRGIVSRIDDAVDFADKLLATNPLFSRANPQVGDRVEKLKTQNRHYLAHEYFNRDWHPMHFATMVDWLEAAKVSYACSANYLDNIDIVNLSDEQQKFLKNIPDLMFRESVRDFMVNQQFRKDYWVKGPRIMNALDRVEAIRAQRIILVSHRPDVSLKVNGSLGEANMSEVVYGPVLDYLADHKPRTIEQLEQAIQQKGINFAQLVEVIMVLAAIGHIAAVQDDAVITKAKKQTDRVNHYICKKARGGNDIIYLASPVTGGGVQVTRFQQLFLLAIGQGKKQPGDWTEFTWQILSSQGQRLIIEGKTLETADDNIAELSAQANSFAQKELPILRALQVA
ncbi:MAG: methyltransferase [Gammaproteobacteria bacterium]|nr:methyltransferase [Gammaproteobacteria bacterium]|tara:strand:+ start:4471 stop:6006 length:1536 start_codon:yes stop_codon:yes gene_type:complete